MARTFYLITPCGRTTDDLVATAASVVEVAGTQPAIEFVHHIVFNNGATSAMLTDDANLWPTNYHRELADLGADGTRAAARNLALDRISENEIGRGIVCFLDAGDVLLDDSAIDVAFSSNDHAQAIWAFSARIVGSDISSTRRPRPLQLRKINNPFFIGATYATCTLATKARFGEGAKEDWKYWLELLDHDPYVERRAETAYEYRVVSTANHLNRKSRLLADQYRFFSDYLGYGHGVRTASSLLAHVAIAGGSWLRRSNRWRPTYWRSR